MPPTHPLRPVNPDNAWAPRLTAAAGTRLASPYSSGTINLAAFSQRKALYAPKSFFVHAASLDQAFAHCRMFLTAATRRCMDRVAVPLVGIKLSLPLAVIALVSRYLANKLIARRPFPERLATLLSIFLDSYSYVKINICYFNLLSTYGSTK